MPDIKHMPVPWKIAEHMLPTGALFEIKPEGFQYLIASVRDVNKDPVNKANAEFIVKAVNDHYVLVNALRKLVGMEAWIGDPEMKDLFQRTVYPAIEQAEK